MSRITLVVIMTWVGPFVWGQTSTGDKGARASTNAPIISPNLFEFAPLENSPPTATATNSTPTNLSGFIPDDNYKLRAGDKISLQILEDKDPPVSLVISDTGELDAPYVGHVLARDKTCKQLGADLKTLLEKDYYYQATVILVLDAVNKHLGRVYIVGEVKSPGTVEMTTDENLTVAKAILKVGGFAEFANKKKVKVIRGADAAGSQKQTLEVNMVDVLENGMMERDVPLRPEDLVIVPSRLVNF